MEASGNDKFARFMDKQGVGRGLNASTFQLNFSALYVTGGARKGGVAHVNGVLGGV
jgi:hypothetical protein